MAITRTGPSFYTIIVISVTLLAGLSAYIGDIKVSGIPFGHKLILEDPKGSSDSSVSPDGKWLAYTSIRSGNLDIWLVNIETGKSRQLTKNPNTDNEPRWHPDGCPFYK
ncbi:TolB family protein [Pseudomonadota bacterium]